MLICAWHRIEKVTQPHAGRAQAALASICLQTTMRTSPKCAPHVPCPGPWVLPKETGNVEKFKCEDEKSKTPLVLEQAGSRSLPSRGFRPCPCRSSGSVCGELMVNHGKPQQGFSPNLCPVPVSSVLGGNGDRSTQSQPFPGSLNSLEKRRCRGVCKSWVTPSPNTQGRRQRAPPSRKVPFSSVKRRSHLYFHILMVCENSTSSSLPQILYLLARKGKLMTPEQI